MKKLRRMSAAFALLLLTGCYGISGISAESTGAEETTEITENTEAEKEGKASEAAGGFKTSGSSYSPLEHTYPEELLLFLARENGQEEAYSTEKIASLYVNQDYGIQSQPLQTITEPGVLEEFRKAVEGIEVLGISDSAGMTDSDVHYRVTDENDETLFYFSTQNGCLDGMYHLYELKGLEALQAIDAIKLIP